MARGDKTSGPAQQSDQDSQRRIYVPLFHEETYYQGLYLAAALSAASVFTSAGRSSPMPQGVRDALVRDEVPLTTLRAFLSLSGLSRFDIRVILFTARGTNESGDTATVTRAEFYTVVRLVQLRQNGLTAASDFYATMRPAAGGDDARISPLRPAYFHTVSGTSVALPPLFNLARHGDDALIVRLPLQKRKAAQQSANEIHVPTCTSAHHSPFCPDQPSEERSPSFELERLQQVRMTDRQARFSIGSERDLDCDETSIAVTVADGDYNNMDDANEEREE